MELRSGLLRRPGPQQPALPFTSSARRPCPCRTYLRRTCPRACPCLCPTCLCSCRCPTCGSPSPCRLCHKTSLLSTPVLHHCLSVLAAASSTTVNVKTAALLRGVPVQAVLSRKVRRVLHSNHNRSTSTSCQCHHVREPPMLLIGVTLAVRAHANHGVPRELRGPLIFILELLAQLVPTLGPHELIGAENQAPGIRVHDRQLLHASIIVVQRLGASRLQAQHRRPENPPAIRPTLEVRRALQDLLAELVPHKHLSLEAHQLCHAPSIRSKHSEVAVGGRTPVHLGFKRTKLFGCGRLLVRRLAPRTPSCSFRAARGTPPHSERRRCNRPTDPRPRTPSA